MKNHFFSKVTNLNNTMVEDFISVNLHANPIYAGMNSFEHIQLLHVFKQYTFFSKNIVPFLLDANLVVKYFSWDLLSAEIVLNITEELGNHGEHLLDASFDKMPHYILLRKGFKESLNIDICDLEQSCATIKFIKDIKECVNNIDPGFVAGSTYALESSATPELEMVYLYVKKCFELVNVKVPECIKFYFESHISDIEIGHENRLKEVCSIYLDTEEKLAHFESGFRQVLSIMDTWWKELHGEMMCLK